MHPGSQAPAAAIPGDPRALLPYLDDLVHPYLGDTHLAAQTADKKLKEQLADMKATAYATELMTQRGGVDGRGHYAFLSTLETIDDPLVREKVKQKFEAFTNEKLEHFIDHAGWAGKRDKDQALDLISAERGATEAKIAAMSPERRQQLDAKASKWAQEVRTVTRIDGANDDANAKKVADVLRQRSPEEIEAMRHAMRRDTNGEHTIYEELDRSLSKGNEDEAIAGLKGDPVYAVQIGLANANGDPVRVKELLHGLKGEQIIEFHRRNPMGTSWVAALVDDGVDRREIEQLVDGRKDKADGTRIANLLEEPGAGAKVTGVKMDETTKRNLEDRKPANIIKELEGKSPAELIAAEQAWDSDPAHAGKSFKEMVESRFGSEPSTNKLRIEALLRGDHAADKVYQLRDGMRSHDQEEVEQALSNPDLKSNDPAKKAAAMKEREDIETRAKQLDEVDQRVVAMAKGEDPSGATGRGIAVQLEASYKEAVEHPKVEGDLFERTTIMVAPERNKDKRAAQAADNQIATGEVLGTGAVSTETQIHRADKKGDTKAEAQLLDGIRSNKELGDVDAQFKAKYNKPLTAAPQLAMFEYGAQLAKMQGDDRPIEEIELEIARDKMTATELQIENVREYGAKAARRPDLEDRLQHELRDKQHSSSLDNSEALRALAGGNVGTEDLAREQLAVMDDKLEPSKDPYGVLPRELKAGVTKEEFQQIDENLTSTLEVQREEKTKLANKIATIFSTIAKLAAFAAGQPELIAAIDMLAGLGQMAIKKQIAGEAYDPADDAKMLAITAVMDVATVGIARYGGAAKVGEETAAEAAEEGLATEAGEEIVHDGAKTVAKEAGVAETELAQDAEQAVGATANDSWKTAANLGVASAGTVAMGIVQNKSPGEIFADVLKGGLTQFLPAALGRRMQEAIGDADKARVLLGQLAGFGAEFGTNYGINGSVADAFVMTAGAKIHSLMTGGLPQPRGEAVEPTEAMRQLTEGASPPESTSAPVNESGSEVRQPLAYGGAETTGAVVEHPVATAETAPHERVTERIDVPAPVHERTTTPMPAVTPPEPVAPTATNSPRTVARANARLASLEPGARAQYEELFAQTENRGQQVLLERAIAAGASIEDLRRLQGEMLGQSESDVLREFSSDGMAQLYCQSCVPTSYQIAIAEVNPVAAMDFFADPGRAMQAQRNALEMGGAAQTPRPDLANPESGFKRYIDNPDAARALGDESRYDLEGIPGGIDPTEMAGGALHKQLEKATGVSYENLGNETESFVRADGGFGQGEFPHERIGRAVDSQQPVLIGMFGHERTIVAREVEPSGEITYIVTDPWTAEKIRVPASDLSGVTVGNLVLPREGTAEAMLEQPPAATPETQRQSNTSSSEEQLAASDSGADPLLEPGGMTSEPIDGPPMDPAQFERIKRAFERQGGVIAQDDEAQMYLRMREASAVTLNEKTMVLGLEPTASEVFEEFIHTAQYRTGRATGANVVAMEIEAARKLIRNRRQYGISAEETRQTIARLRRLYVSQEEGAL